MLECVGGHPDGSVSTAGKKRDKLSVTAVLVRKDMDV